MNPHIWGSLMMGLSPGLSLVFRKFLVLLGSQLHIGMYIKYLKPVVYIYIYGIPQYHGTRYIMVVILHILV